MYKVIRERSLNQTEEIVRMMALDLRPFDIVGGFNELFNPDKFENSVPVPIFRVLADL